MRLVGTVSILVFFAGVFQMTNATLGVGLICSACFLGIMARIDQADKHQEKLVENLKNIQQSISNMNKG